MERTVISENDQVNRLLNEGGVDAVLDRIGRLQSDSIRRVYFQELFSQGDLNEQELDVTLRTLGRRISSDSERRNVLVHVIDSQKMGANTVGPFMAAVQQMNSDSERRNVVIAYIKENPIPASHRR